MWTRVRVKALTLLLHCDLRREESVDTGESESVNTALTINFKA